MPKNSGSLPSNTSNTRPSAGPPTNRTTIALNGSPTSPAPACAALGAAHLLELLELEDGDFRLGLVRHQHEAAADLSLLTADLLEGLAHVGVEARAVAEFGVEDMFHAISCAVNPIVPVTARGYCG